VETHIGQNDTQTPCRRKDPKLKRLPTTVAAVGLALTLLGACSSSSNNSSSSTPSSVASSSPSTSSSTSSSSGTTTDATPAIVSAANAFLATLTDTEKASVQFDFTNTAQRQKWSNLPQGAFQRAGLEWSAMSTASQDAWFGVMKATLSTKGFDQVMAEWKADDALAATSGSGGGGGLVFGTGNYWVALIGAPSTTDPWQWQWGGHHVTVNATIKGTNVSLTPSFIGVQPSSYTDSSGQTIRPLGAIDDAAFSLVNSLDATEQQAAILGSTYIDLVLGPGQDGKTIPAEGLAGAQMTDTQKAAFLALIDLYGGLVNDEDGAARKAQLQADLDNTYFAWYGPTTQGSPSYFRVTGPHIVIEYSPQSMGGDASLHIHGMYRDPTNDYGAYVGAGI
jgi:Protein of unknown function (DUF3500)